AGASAPAPVAACAAGVAATAAGSVSTCARAGAAGPSANTKVAETKPAPAATRFFLFIAFFFPKIRRTLAASLSPDQQYARQTCADRAQVWQTCNREVEPGHPITGTH